MILSEKLVHYKDVYAGTVDIVCGISDFDSELVFNADNHTYELNGKPLPSVTSLLDYKSDYHGIAATTLEKAAERGTAIHKEIEEYLKNGTVGSSYEFREFVRVMEDNPIPFVKKSVIEIKTYSAMSEEKKKKVLMQLNLYAKAIEEMTGEHIDEKYIIWLQKEPKKGRIIKLEEETNEYCELSW